MTRQRQQKPTLQGSGLKHQRCPTSTPTPRKVKPATYMPTHGEFIVYVPTESGTAKCLVHKKAKRGVICGQAPEQVITVNHLTVISGCNARGLINQEHVFSTGAVIKSSKQNIVTCIKPDTAKKLRGQLNNIDYK